MSIVDVESFTSFTYEIVRCAYIHHCDVCCGAGANAKSNAGQTRDAAPGPANNSADCAPGTDRYSGNASRNADCAAYANHAGDPGTDFPGDQAAAVASVAGPDASRCAWQQRDAAITYGRNSQSTAEQ